VVRVAVFNGPGRPITVERFDDPELGPGDVRIAIGRCGICGSDLSMTSGSIVDFATGGTMGHGYAGEVVEVGRDVTRFKAGDRVTCLPKVGCGNCAACAEGRTVYCMAGPLLFAGFADFLVAPQESTFHLPQSVSIADGALVEPMSCGLRGLRMAGMKGGERIMVLGAGTTALAIIYWARKLGAGKILVASRSARRHDVAMAFGADAVHSFDDDDPDSLLEALGGPPDIVAECVGKPGMLAKAVDHARLGGTVLSLGMCVTSDTLVPALPALKEVRMIFPAAYSTSEFVETIEAFESGAVRPDSMVSDVIPLDALPATIEQMRGPHDFLKVHVDPRMTYG
jgi:(R,R)-butanediol dehydrogenase/meso-butanediol dehydrogenase/diacetyl reductase